MPATQNIPSWSLSRSQRSQRGRSRYLDNTPSLPPLITTSPVVGVYAVATTDQALSGTPTIDGISTWYDYLPILLTGQTDPEENGVWHWLSGGWIRSDNPLDIGQMYYVSHGTLHAGSTWQCIDMPWTGDYPEPEFRRRTPYEASAVLTFTTPIGAGLHAELTFTCSGVTVGDAVSVSPDGDPGAGVVWSSWVLAADTITVRIINATAAPITLTDRTWRASVIPS